MIFNKKQEADAFEKDVKLREQKSFKTLIEAMNFIGITLEQLETLLVWWIQVRKQKGY